MYEILKSVIFAGGYKLADIQRKAKKLYTMGELTESQLDELLSLASGGVSTDAERPETLQLIQTLAKEIECLKERVKALESTNDEGGNEETEEPTYPAWKPWDGISKDYQTGAVVSHSGKLWESVFAGQNVWEPGAAGTDSLWVEK